MFLMDQVIGKSDVRKFYTLQNKQTTKTTKEKQKQRVGKFILLTLFRPRGEGEGWADSARGDFGRKKLF